MLSAFLPLSDAFKNRFVEVNLKNLSRNELIAIFTSSGQTETAAQQIADNYLKKLDTSKEKNKIPPTLGETLFNASRITFILHCIHGNTPCFLLFLKLLLSFAAPILLIATYFFSLQLIY